MSEHFNLKLGKRIYELFSQNQIDELANLFSEDAVLLHVPTNMTFKGREGYKQTAKIWKSAFSDAWCDVKNQFANDDYIVTEFNGVGTHDGNLETPMGTIGPTGKKVSVPFLEILQIKNEKIVSYKLYFDVATMMQQLGVTPVNA